MKLSEIIHRKNNNADVLRLVAAVAVIYGHAYALGPSNGKRDVVNRLLGFDSSGPLAVKFFFVLSGILVTNSLLERRSGVEFACARFFRIIPALVVSALVCTLLMGPALTTLPLREYFAQTDVVGIALRHPWFDYLLPGVFKNHNYPQINGSIWTIQYELMMYVMLLALWMTGLLRSKIVGSAICILTIVMSYADPSFVTYFGLDYASNGNILPAFFAAGVLLAINKEYIEINITVVAGLYLVAICLHRGPAAPYVFYAAFLIGALWLSTTAPIRRIKLPGDYSYGVYVYGWPVQQAVIDLWPGLGVHGNQIVTILIAFLLALFSFHFVEKPAIDLGRWLAKRWKTENPQNVILVSGAAKEPVAEPAE